MKSLQSIISIVFDAVLSLLTIRWILLFFGANAQVPLIRWTYGLTDQLVWPIAGALPAIHLAGLTIDLDTLLAMLFYAAISFVLIELVSYLHNRLAVASSNQPPRMV